MIRKLRVKFICINMLIVTLMLLVVLGALYAVTSRDLAQESIRMMEAVADRPVQLMRPDGRPGARPENVRLPYFTVQTGPHGELIVTGSDYFDLSDEAFLQELLTAAEDAQARTGVLRAYGLRYLRAETPMGETVVFADMTSERATLRSLLRTCALVAAAAFAVLLAVSVLLARWAVRPVEEAWRQQKQFVADASHELKTPLTVILTNAELLQSPEYDDAERAQFSRNILTMAGQMRGLVEDLLELARVDQGRAAAEMERVSFSDLVADALLPFEPVFFEKNVRLASTVEPDVAVRGNAAYLRRAVEVLLDNAQKYTPAGGAAEVALTRAAHNRCLLTVSNTGAALSDAELRDIFKRFYRGDAARRMEHSYGLGLSIAQRVVEAHRGKIWAESADGVNRFYVELPLWP